jgi:subtilisin family serine protease
VSAAPATNTDGQILVMLRDSSIRHYRPGVSAVGGYGSGSASSPQLRTAGDLARQYGFKVVSDWPMPALGIRCFLAVVEPGHVPSEVAARLAGDPRVESAQAVQVFHVLGHNDAYYELQTSATALRLDQLHQMATGKNVRIAEIDTGVELKHPDLDGQLARAKNLSTEQIMSPNGGTAVAGIIVAKADNGIGIVSALLQSTPASMLAAR